MPHEILYTIIYFLLPLGAFGQQFTNADAKRCAAQAKSITTGGSSFHPTAPNFTDQAQGYLDGKFKDVWFYKADALKHMQKIYHP